MERLLEGGADVHAKTLTSQLTARDLAELVGHKEVVEKLAAYGAGAEASADPALQ